MADAKENKEVSKLEHEEEESGIKFSPPVSQQRHQRVLDLVREFRVKKLADFGCNDCQFIKLLRRENSVKEIFGIDVDRTIVERQVQRLRPLAADYLTLRPCSLKIQLYEGCITEYDERLRDVDMVTLIEVVEHLFPDILKKFPENIFGNLRPKIVVVTTPNADFNVLFKKLKHGKFRHWDHKFEWTREQFQKWCKDNATKYNYDVTYTGIGKGPEGTENYGCCSQMAVFIRNSTSRKNFLKSRSTETSLRPYKLIGEVVFPFINDDKHVKERIKQILHGICENATKSRQNHQENDNFIKTKLIFEYPYQIPPKNNIKTAAVTPEKFKDARNDRSSPTEVVKPTHLIPGKPKRARPTKFIKFLQEKYFLNRKDEVFPGQFEDVVEKGRDQDFNGNFISSNTESSVDVNSNMFGLKCSELLFENVFSESAKIRLPFEELVDFMADVGIEVSANQVKEVLQAEENCRISGKYVSIDLEKVEDDDSLSKYGSDGSDIDIVNDYRSKNYTFTEFMNESWGS